MCDPHGFASTPKTTTRLSLRHNESRVASRLRQRVARADEQHARDGHEPRDDARERAARLRPAERGDSDRRARRGSLFHLRRSNFARCGSFCDHASLSDRRRWCCKSNAIAWFGCDRPHRHLRGVAVEKDRVAAQHEVEPATKKKAATARRVTSKARATPSDATRVTAIDRERARDRTARAPPPPRPGPPRRRRPVAARRRRRPPRRPRPQRGREKGFHDDGEAR